MSAKAQLCLQYRAVVKLWPADTLRPQTSFQSFLHGRIAKQFGMVVEGDAMIPTQNHSAASTTGNMDVEEGKPVIKFNETKVSSELNALQTLLEDRYKKKYPITEKLLRPKGNPGYYESLVEELKQAPKRTWLQRKLNSWKGYIRIK